MAFVPGSIVAKYTQPTGVSGGSTGFVPGSIVAKYTQTTAPDTVAPTSSVAKDWLGIKNPDTYFQDALKQAGDFIMHPVQGVENVAGAIGGAFSSAIGGAYQANKTALGDLTNNQSWAQKTADVLHSVGADAAVVFSPITAAFSAAAEVPVLKEAADVLQMPFAVTGKIGDFATETFIKALPLSQENKDLLAPAFGEIGSLAGQVLLGGRIINLIARGVGIDKAQIDTAIKDAQSKAEIAKQEALKRQQMQPQAPVAPQNAPTAPITPETSNVAPVSKLTGRDVADRVKEALALPTDQLASKADYITPYGTKGAKTYGFYVDNGNPLEITIGADGQKFSHGYNYNKTAPTASETTSPLAQEAQKYSSAEEFVSPKILKTKDLAGRNIPDLKNTLLYHTTSETGARSITSQGFKNLPTDQAGYYGRAISLTPDAEYTRQFGDITTVNKIIPKANILNLGTEKGWNTWTALFPDGRPELSLMRDVALKNGIDGVYDAGAGHLFVYNPKIIENMGSFPKGVSLDVFKSQLIDFYNKVKPAEVKTEPIAGAPKPIEGTPSGLAKSIEAKLTEQGTIDHAKEVAQYEGSTIKEQAKIFDQTATKGVDEIRAIVRGEKSLPEGGKPFSFIVNTEAYLKDHPNADLAHELINSPLVSATSEGASNLGLGQNRIQDSYTAKAREIQKAREVKSKATPESKANLKKKAKAEGVVGNDKINLAPSDLGKLESFIDKIVC